MECIVEFDYFASQKDELTIRKGDIITNVISFEDGWKRGSLNGKEGVFPDNFVRVVKPTTDFSENHNSLDQEAISEVKDNIMNSSKVHHSSLSEIASHKSILSFSSPSVNKKSYVVNILPSMDKKKWSSNNITLNQGSILKTENSKSELSKSLPQQSKEKKTSTDSKHDSNRVIVIFNYNAENPDELQLEEGEIVKVLDKNLIDEGWWKGIKKSGEIGIFPSNFVQEYIENTTASSIKKSSTDDHHLMKTTPQESNRDQSNITGSLSLSDFSHENKTPKQMTSNQGLTVGPHSNFTFKTKNVYGNSCSIDNLNDIGKSKKSQDNQTRSQSTIFRLRPVNGNHETSRGDDTSNSLDRNFEVKTQIRSHEASPANKDFDCHLLKSDFERFKQEVDQKMSKLSMRIQTLVDEIDEEKKQRAASEIELVRLRRVVHMLDAQSLNGFY